MTSRFSLMPVGFACFAMLADLPATALRAAVRGDDTTPPVTAIVSPSEGAWFLASFDVSLSDSDANLDLDSCEYQVVTDGSGLPATWLIRPCSGTVNVGVGAASTCSIEGSSGGEVCKIYARSADISGNISAAVSVSVGIDYTADTLAVLSAQTGPGGSTIGNGEFTNDNTPYFSWSATSASPIVGFSYAQSSPPDCSPDGTDNFFQSLALGDGAHDFRVRAIDLAGNCGLPASFSFGVDTASDSVTALAAFTSQGGDPIADGDWTGDNTPYFSWSATSASPIVGFSYAQSSPPDCSPDGTDNFFQSLALGDGAHDFRVRAIDLAGNCGPPASFSFGVDTTSDSVIALAAFTSQGEDPIADGDWTGDNTPFFSWSATSTSPIEGFSHAQGGTPDCTPEGVDNFFQSPALGDGEHDFRVRVLDAAGNCGSVASTTLGIDTGPDPILEIRGYTESGGEPIFSGSAQTDSDLFFDWDLPASTAPVSGFAVGLGEPSDCLQDTVVPEWTEGPFPLGTTVLWVRALDAAANCGPEAQFAVVVVDAADLIFVDGFESGDTTGWDAVAH